MKAATVGEEEKAIMVNDVRRAFFYAKALRPVWVELPEEDYSEEDREEDMVGKLEMSLYGIRDAGANLHLTYSSFLKGIGMTQCITSHCHFIDEARELKGIVHGDDF